MRSPTMVGQHGDGKTKHSPVTADYSLGPVAHPASFGDHPAIVALLNSAYSQGIDSDFQSQAEAPDYCPDDRLIIRRGHAVVAHGRVTWHVMSLGHQRLPIAWLGELATARDARGLGLGQRVIQAAEAKMIEQRCDLGMLRTHIPEYYERLGWVSCFKPSYSLVDPRLLLAKMSTEAKAAPTALDEFRANVDRPIIVRLWRRMDLDAISEIYTERTRSAYGPFRRSPDRWRWLIDRRGYDQIYLAYSTDDDDNEVILGYLIMCRGRVAEIFTRGDDQAVMKSLLARVCADTIESDEGSIRIDAPPESSIHLYCREAGGINQHSSQETFMAKVLSPITLLTKLRGALYQRARQSSEERLPALGLLIDDNPIRIEMRARSVQVEEGKLARSYLECSASELSLLLLGQLSIEDSSEDGRIQASTRNAIRLGQAYFPQLPLWRPPFDELMA